MTRGTLTGVRALATASVTAVAALLLAAAPAQAAIITDLTCSSAGGNTVECSVAGWTIGATQIRWFSDGDPVSRYDDHTTMRSACRDDHTTEVKVVFSDEDSSDEKTRRLRCRTGNPMDEQESVGDDELGGWVLVR